MDAETAASAVITREALLHALYEAAELEHNLMCTYLYAAFSLRTGEQPDFSPDEAAAVARWRSEIMRVAVDEMGHLTAVWNITSALGGTPRFGRGNFPLDHGALPAGVVVKLVPFGEAALQHFIHLERPVDSQERDGEGFSQPYLYARGIAQPRLTPMPVDYDTVGAFYATLSAELRAFVAVHGEAASFSGDPALQLSQDEVALQGARPVLCAKTALGRVLRHRGAGRGGSRRCRQLALPALPRDSHGAAGAAGSARRLRARVSRGYQPGAAPPAGRRRARLDRRRSGSADRGPRKHVLRADVAAARIRLCAAEAERRKGAGRRSRARLDARDDSAGRSRCATPGQRALPRRERRRHVLRAARHRALGRRRERTQVLLRAVAELTEASRALASSGAPRLTAALTLLENLQARAVRGFARADQEPTVDARSAVAPRVSPPEPTISHGVEAIEGTHLTLLFEAKKCIHARFCVTGAPRVFLANVEGPWIHPDAMDVESLAGIAHVCPSGAIRYRRKDGRPDEAAPPVNLLAIREAGPYALRGQLELDGAPIGYRATLCRCGASKNKPYCDGSHHDVAFGASGEPATGAADMLPVRDGLLAIEAEPDGPLAVRGNLEITSGTGRVVSRLTRARLCRCGGSANKPFCDGTHVRIGFRSQT